MTDFRALCAELLDELKYQTDWSIAEELKERACTALAEPEPEGPTDQELLRLYKVATPCYHVEEYRRELDFGRAVYSLAISRC